MSEELEPCPFCGEGYFFNFIKVERTQCKQVECVSCGATGPVGENNKVPVIDGVLDSQPPETRLNYEQTINVPRIPRRK